MTGCWTVSIARSLKQAFNAMVQASTPLKNCPRDIDMSGVAMNWPELRDRILKRTSQ